MAAFAKFYRNRFSIVDKYFDAVNAAQEVRQKEYDAAVTIQSTWRMYKDRKETKKLHEKAALIQSIWRRYRCQMLLRCLIVEAQNKERTAYFNLMATKIQKAWRGYFARKHTFNYHKQKEFLENVAAKNNEMKLMIEQYSAETAAAAQEAAEKRQAEYEINRASHEHYMVSTQAIPSVYNPPEFTRDAEAMPAVEQFIRAVNRARIVIPSIGKR